MPASDEALLGFLYVTDPLAGDLGSILTYLRQTTGIEDWVGTVGMGVAATGVEYFDRPAGVALAAPLPKDGFFVFPAVGADMEDFPDDGKDWVDRVSPPFGIVHGDPNNPDDGCPDFGACVGGTRNNLRCNPHGAEPDNTVALMVSLAVAVCVRAPEAVIVELLT